MNVECYMLSVEYRLSAEGSGPPGKLTSRGADLPERNTTPLVQGLYFKPSILTASRLFVLWYYPIYINMTSLEITGESEAFDISFLTTYR